MRIHTGHVLATVGTNCISVIYGELLIWIDSNQYNAYTVHVNK